MVSRLWGGLALALVTAGAAWSVLGHFWRVDATHGEAEPVAQLIRPVRPAPVTDGPSVGQKPAARVLDEVARQGVLLEAPAQGSLSADAVSARVSLDPLSVHRQTAGKRMRLEGQLVTLEEGEAGVVVLHLALSERPGTLRVVASPGLAQRVTSWTVPQAVSLDCLSQGVMMGEWLLVDCKR